MHTHTHTHARAPRRIYALPVKQESLLATGHSLDQLRDHTGKKRRYWLVLKEIIRAAPCFFLRVLA
jgi:hypothetical protein